MLAQNKCSTHVRGYWGALVHPDLNFSCLAPDAFITIVCICRHTVGFPCGSVVRNPPAMQEPQVQSLGQEVPWRRKWQLTAVFFPEKSPGQRNLAGYSLWGFHKRVGHNRATEHACM